MAMMTETQSTIGFSDSLGTRLMAAFHAMTSMMRFHRTLRILEELNDIVLRDIGLTRGDLSDLRIASSEEAVRAMTRIRRSH
jgi:uncharacterized protein YjiS (DUF1127 family)